MTTTETETLATTTPASQPSTPVRMSYEEWLSWEHTSSVTEWVDGEVIIVPPPSIIHQRIVGLLSTLLSIFVQIHQLGLVLASPVGMRIIPGGNARKPDLLFLATEHHDQLSERELHGPADLIVEVVSEESIARDRADKFYEYQAGGVREYWIIDPRAGKQRVDLYVLDAQGRYQPVPPTAEGTYHSSVLAGFWIKEEWLWMKEPNVLHALAAIIGPDRMLAALQGQA